jgi:CheY-like chemotaxis protein
MTMSELKAEVKVTKTAREAITALTKFKPHILLSDIGMPGEDGYALIRKVRASKDKHIKTLPALALTAYASDDDAKRALAAGFQAHIAKPFKPVQLAKAILEFAKRLRRR